jgi:uncharacterized protein YggT (Ycf19 family)
MARSDLTPRERELLRQRELEREATRERPTRDDEFRESLAAPAPTSTYRSRIDRLETGTSPLEQLIRYVTVILGALLVVRFAINLFTYNRVNGFVNFFNGATDWVVRPFQTLFGQPPSGSGGFFDWPAVVSLIVVALIATLLVSLIRPRDYQV